MNLESRFVNRFPRGCLTSTEAIRAVLNESKDHGFLDGDIFVGDDSPQWQKDEVFLRAEALYISSHHSNVPWCTGYDCTMVGILLVESGGVIGAVGFDNVTDFGDRESVTFEEWRVKIGAGRLLLSTRNTSEKDTSPNAYQNGESALENSLQHVPGAKQQDPYLKR